MDLVASLWEILTTTGGTLALSFIIALALGINALTVFFVGSAVVVLERFARVAQRWRWTLCFGALLSVGAAAVLVRLDAPELSARSWSDWLGLFGWALAASAGVSAAAGDLTDDGQVGVEDLVIVLTAWGGCP